MDKESLIKKVNEEIARLQNLSPWPYFSTREEMVDELKQMLAELEVGNLESGIRAG